MSEARTYTSICQQYKHKIEFIYINFNDEIKKYISPH